MGARSAWVEAVAKAVASIPRGSTASYAQVALLAGHPGAARAVVRALHALDGEPWWRVVRSDRTLAPQVAVEQARRLRAEGVEVRGRRVYGAAAPASKRAHSSTVRAGRS